MVYQFPYFVCIFGCFILAYPACGITKTFTHTLAPRFWPSELMQSTLWKAFYVYYLRDVSGFRGFCVGKRKRRADKGRDEEEGQGYVDGKE